MNIPSIVSISPLTGRYAKKVQKLLEDSASEFALIKARILVEIEWLIFLSEGPKCFTLPDEEKNKLRDIHKEFSVRNAEEIKEIEKKTNHDVKAVEYFLKERLPKSYRTFVHYGLTSEDTDNLARAIITRDQLEVLLKCAKQVSEALWELQDENRGTVMLALTHGQPALPTTLGKEISVYTRRIDDLRRVIGNGYNLDVKCAGAVGTMASFNLINPHYDWIVGLTAFTKTIDERTKPSESICDIRFRFRLEVTQIKPHDDFAAIFHSIVELNTVLVGFCQDIWWYISREVFLQKPKDGDEVGSSTMPQKINPINFENAEAHLGLANALFNHFAQTLPISRFQRHLSDSAIQRYFGEAVAMSVIAYENIIAGLRKLTVNVEGMKKELEDHPEILAEAYQLILKKNDIENGYEIMKDFFRGKKLSKEEILLKIDSLIVPDHVRVEMKQVTVFNYLGNAKMIAGEY